MSDEFVEYSYWNIPLFYFSKQVEDYKDKMTWEDIDTAYRRLYLENYLSTWSERLVEYGEYELPARQILKLLATLPEDIEREGMLNILMTGQDASKIEAVDYTLKILSY